MGLTRSRNDDFCWTNLTCSKSELTMTTDRITLPPFDSFVHILTKTAEDPNAIPELRRALHQSPAYIGILKTYPEAAVWCTDMQLNRFLAARGYQTAPALKLLISALEWRARRKPELVERQPGFEESFGKQGATGKVYCPGFDRFQICDACLLTHPPCCPPLLPYRR